MTRRPAFWLAVLLTGLTCYRFSTIGSGHFYTGDESRYFAAERMVNDLSVGDYHSAARRPFEILVRPAFVLVSTIPAAAQRVVGSWRNLDPQSLAYYDAAAAFNVLVALGVGVCMFALARRWTSSGWYALLITMLCSLTVCANVWVRHLVGYYESQLFLLLALLAATAPSFPTAKYGRRAFLAGVLSAIGFTCYPGYYTFVLVNAAVVVAVAPRRRLVALAMFGVSAAAILGGFDLLARTVGRSYFADMFSLPQIHAELIKIPIAEEGHTFMWCYLRDVEGPIGIVLLLLFAAFIGIWAWRRNVPIPRSARVALIAIIFCYAIHATQAAYRHRMAVYGRVMLMYVPFIVCGAVLAVRQIGSLRLRQAMVCGMVAMSAWSFVAFARWYSTVRYPEDAFFDTIAVRGQAGAFSPNVLWTKAGTKLTNLDETGAPLVAMVADAYPDGFYSYNLPHEAAAASGARFIGVNLKWVRDIPEERHYFETPAGYRLIFEDVAAFAHPPMAYEERAARERELLAQHHYTMRIYERIDPATVPDNPLRTCTRDEHAQPAAVNSPG